MKYILSFLFMACLVNTALTQTPLRVGYFSPYFLQPGIKMGTEIALTKIPGNAGSIAKQRTLTVSPQAAYFVQPRVEQNLMINTEWSIPASHRTGMFMWRYAPSLGYLMSIQTQEESVQLGSGNTQKTTKTLHHFVPAVNIGFDIRPRGGLGGYFHLMAGHLFTGSQENALYTGVEFGFIISLDKTGADATQ